MSAHIPPKQGMRDVSAKGTSFRVATAEAKLRVSPASIQLIRDGQAPKGDPIAVARVAGIQAAKLTPTILPYCHSVGLDYVGLEFDLLNDAIKIAAEVKAIHRTGVEMEAMTAVAVAALNLYDLLKPVDDDMEIEYVRLTGKTGGKSNFDASEAFTVCTVIVSDRASRGEYEDRVGPLLQTSLETQLGTVLSNNVVPDESDHIIAAVEGALSSTPDFVFVCGGTGLGPRDFTIEALSALVKKRLSGIEFRIMDFANERVPTAMMSRPLAGLIGSTVLIVLPGSPQAVADAINALFPYIKHAVSMVKGAGHED